MHDRLWFNEILIHFSEKKYQIPIFELVCMDVFTFIG